MRFPLLFLALATASLSSTTALPLNNVIASGTPLKALRALHEGNTYGSRILRIHEPDDEDSGENEEERGKGLDKVLNKFRYQSKGAHGAEDLNQVVMARNYLQDNPTLFNAIRTDYAKRYETYSIWRGAKFHSDEVKRAMKAHGLDEHEVIKFVKEYKAFKPAKLSFT